MTKKTIIYNDKLVMSTLVQREITLQLQREGKSDRIRVERQKKKEKTEVRVELRRRRRKRDAQKSQGSVFIEGKDEWQKM